MDKIAKCLVMFQCTHLLITIIIVTLLYIHPLHTTSHVSTTQRVPLADCIDMYTYIIDEDMKVFVCKENYVHIRGTVHVRYSILQWYKFMSLLSTIEYGIGIVRIDDTRYIQLRKIDIINLYSENGPVAVTLEQWFTLMNLLPKINSALLSTDGSRRNG